MYKMVSLDTSTTETGFAVFESGKLTRNGTIKRNGKDVPKRVDEMISSISNLLKKECPNLVVIEDLAVFNNMATNKNLAEIIGFVRGYCVLNDICFDRLSPSRWRKLVARENEKVPIKRVDCKPWDLEVFNRYYPRRKVGTNDNIADATLIGVAYMKMFGIAI